MPPAPTIYGRAVGPGVTLLYAIRGGLDGLLRTVWLWALPLAFFSILKVVPERPFWQWIYDSRIAIGIYLFLVAMYAAQCGLFITAIYSRRICAMIFRRCC